MYAVIVTGGKQYRVTPGGYVDVERLPGEVGDQVALDQVLMIADGEEIVVGQPTVSGAQVLTTVTGQGRHRKVLHFHYVAKKRQRVKRGHRQYYTRLRVDEIQQNGEES